APADREVRRPVDRPRPRRGARYRRSRPIQLASERIGGGFLRRRRARLVAAHELSLRSGGGRKANRIGRSLRFALRANDGSLRREPERAAPSLDDPVPAEAVDRRLHPTDRAPRRRGQSREARGGPFAQGGHDPPPDLAVGSLEGLLLLRGGGPPIAAGAAISAPPPERTHLASRRRPADLTTEIHHRLVPRPGVAP